ncbi:TIGR02453 family protein [Noviherbaspirillum humi]|uniref:TIGR02453 family protein n=1 Tax=Noviherbaspirillum humi TaxID=1688639 RepID=A0A239JCA7_9BURK|nr:DUF2461 domain-containing protein [Noviherbaspirillum humi]SNT03475.1 TIGR02453 family protein [Noviherbaspirillum humi]
MHVRDLIGYLGELAENNNRAWFVMNKPRYDILRAEFLELVVRLIREIGKFDPAVADCNPKKALFRINRDIRFSHDKSPYKTYFSAAITASGLKKPSQGGGPSYYFHIDANGTLLVAGGEYMPPPARLKAIRERVIEDAAGFGKMLKNKRLKQTYGDLQEECKLKRLPKGFENAEVHPEYLKLKSFIVWTETSLKNKKPDDLAEQIVSGFRDSQPLVNWLREIPLA